MALGKQAKILTKGQANSVTAFLLSRRHGLRDQTVFLLSVRAGLRAKEIANLKWAMVVVFVVRIFGTISYLNATNI